MPGQCAAGVHAQARARERVRTRERARARTGPYFLILKALSKMSTFATLLGAALIAVGFHVAPMQCFTNAHLRFLLRRLNPDAVLWTEMEKADFSPRVDLARRLLGGSASLDDQPVVLQLGGSDPALLARAASAALTQPGFACAEINLNCGCPTVQVASRTPVRVWMGAEGGGAGLEPHACHGMACCRERAGPIPAAPRTSALL